MFVNEIVHIDEKRNIKSSFTRVEAVSRRNYRLIMSLGTLQVKFTGAMLSVTWQICRVRRGLAVFRMIV